MSIVATAGTVSGYIGAVGAGSAVTGDDGVELTPPAALVTFCLSACLAQVGLPPDAIHFAQEFEAHAPVAVGEALVLHARIASKRRIAGAGRVEVAFLASDRLGVIRLSGRALILLPSGTGE